MPLQSVLPAMTDAAMQQLRAVVGDKGWVDAPQDIAPWLTDSRGVLTGACAAMLKPASTEEVSRILSICAEHAIAVVPQGGNTGRCGGATPDNSGRAVVVNLSRMNRVREIDTTDYTMTVEAGCILKTLQEEAARVDRLLPLSLGAEGSCQIGGNLATNAGGINVLRYGNARDLVLGLEVVLPGGEVWNGLRRLRKDNRGYDLKHLFLGSEGTLGIITAAVLKLFPAPKRTATAIVAVPDPAAAVALLARARGDSGDALSSFELIGGFPMESALRFVEGARRPLPEPYDWYVLMDYAASRPEADVDAAMEATLAQGFEDGLILDGAIAQSEGQARAFWFLREAILEGQPHYGGAVKTDISVPVSRIPDFLERADKALEAAMPGIRPYPFGHVGDGNLHYNISQPDGMARAEFMARAKEVSGIVNAIAAELDGSFSAEHGVGQIKLDEMARWKAPVELAMMRALKASIDPRGIMNPGKVLPPE